MAFSFGGATSSTAGSKVFILKMWFGLNLKVIFTIRVLNKNNNIATLVCDGVQEATFH